jgi:hypothetical protein
MSTYYSTWGTSTSTTIMSTATPKYIVKSIKKKEVKSNEENDNEVVLFNPEDLVL